MRNRLGSHANYLGIVMQLYSFSIDITEVFTCIHIQRSGFSLGNVDCCTRTETWRQYTHTTQQDTQKIRAAAQNTSLAISPFKLQCRSYALVNDSGTTLV